jgi:hypothetical protein
MSRISRGGSDPIIVKPTSNVYTVLVAVCIVVQVIGFAALFLRHQELFGVGLFSEKTQPRAAATR